MNRALTIADVRLKVQQFALLMEQKLRENDAKGGWHGESTGWLMSRLHQEAEEVTRAIVAQDIVRSLPQTRETAVTLIALRRNIAREAADVANFAMMIADMCLGLTEPTP